MTFLKSILILLFYLLLLQPSISQHISNEEFNGRLQAGWQSYEKQNFQDTIQHWQPILPILQQSYENGDQDMGYMLAKLHIGLGDSYRDLDILSQALHHYELGLSIYLELYGNDNPQPDISFALHNIGYIYYRVGNYSEAKKSHQSALEIKYRLYGKKDAHPDISISLHHLGLVEQALGDYAEALQYHQAALKMCYELYGNSEPQADTATSLDNIGLGYSSLQNYPEALKYHQASLNMRYKLYGKDNPHSDIAASLQNLATLYIRSKQYAKAWQSIRTLDRVSQSLFESYAYMQTETEMRKTWQEYLKPVNDRILSLLCLDIDQKYAAYAYQVVLSNKSTIRRWLGANQKVLLETKNQEVLKLYKEYQSHLQNLANLAFITSDHPHAAAIAQQRQELRRKCKQTEARLNQRCMALRQYPKIELTKIQKQMNAETALMEFVIFSHLTEKKDALGCFVVKKQSVIFVFLGLLEKIQPEVENLLENMQNDMQQLREEWKKSPETGQKYLQNQKSQIQAKAYQVARLLYEPLAKHCSRAKQLVIAPDGFLHLLPFAILTQKSGKNFIYLISRHNFVYCFDGDCVTKASSPLPQDTAFYGIVAPDFDLQPQIPPWLTQKRNELEATILQNNKPRTTMLHFEKLAPPNPWITIANIKSKLLKHLPSASITIHAAQNAITPLAKLELSRADWVHVISHSFFWKSTTNQESQDKKDPILPSENHSAFANSKQADHPLLFYGIALAGANYQTLPNQEDGYLTAQEIALLNLNHIRCMVLFCCGSGLGKPEPAAGFSGLKWALEYAGVQNSILTLWDISDLSHSMVEDFYTNILENKQAIPTALNLVQRRKATLTTYEGHPCIWGAFICHGIPQK